MSERDQMGPMALYACSVCAQEGNRVKSSARYVRARSREEAVGLAMAEAHRTWPQSNGWYGHGASTIQIPDEWIKVRAEWLAGQMSPANEQEWS